MNSAKRFVWVKMKQVSYRVASGGASTGERTSQHSDLEAELPSYLRKYISKSLIVFHVTET